MDAMAIIKINFIDHTDFIQFIDHIDFVPNEEDQILLFSDFSCNPLGSSGIVSLILNAYDNLKDRKITLQGHDFYTFLPDNFATELIKVALIGTPEASYRITPATRMMYQRYGEKGDGHKCMFEYICNFKRDNNSRTPDPGGIYHDTNS